MIDETNSKSDTADSENGRAAELAYGYAWQSFLIGMNRLTSAAFSFATLQARLRGDRELGLQIGTFDEFDQKAPRMGERNFVYMYSAGLLLYGMAMFDSFLSDTTTILLLAKPDALGKSHVVPIGTLISPKARAAVLNKEIARKVRSLSTHHGIEDRIGFVREKFGLSYRLSDNELRDLLKFWTLRNEVAHDQSVFRFEANDDLRNSIVAMGDSPSASRSLEYSVQALVDVCVDVSFGLYRSVLKDFLKLSDDQMKRNGAGGKTFRENISPERLQEARSLVKPTSL